MPADENVASARSGNARLLALGLGAGRVALGAIFLAYPAESMRLLGVDSATAARVAWLARLAAVRDAALGAGVLGSVLTRRAQVPALLASAAVDAADATVIAVAAREGRVDRVRGYATAGAALVVVAAGVAAAADALSRRT